MTEALLAELIAAAAALLGVAAGSFGQIATDWFKDRPQQKFDEGRKRLLEAMLSDPARSWVPLERLKRVIGADDDTAKRLLIELGARGSEEDPEAWGLIRRNPLPSGK